MPPRLLPISLCIAVFVAALCVDPASAQKSSAGQPKYDVQSETKMKGTVEEFKQPSKSSEKEATHLLLKSGTDTIDVYLCPW